MLPRYLKILKAFVNHKPRSKLIGIPFLRGVVHRYSLHFQDNILFVINGNGNKKISVIERKTKKLLNILTFTAVFTQSSSKLIQYFVGQYSRCLSVKNEFRD